MREKLMALVKKWEEIENEYSKEPEFDGGVSYQAGVCAKELREVLEENNAGGALQE